MPLKLGQEEREVLLRGQPVADRAVASLSSWDFNEVVNIPWAWGN